ncbi:EpsG family protein [Leptospira kanakyensis]|uniref:EpsG family protein n=1 Tax=Leptospira kanakyensis TaxID=2484968 RepID=UPI00223CB7E6|nr:EpsG family protein [Leptospira kanakyensis]MCW7482108.1 EpsG family protein [Leptospira kanakyensis]
MQYFQNVYRNLLCFIFIYNRKLESKLKSGFYLRIRKFLSILLLVFGVGLGFFAPALSIFFLTTCLLVLTENENKRIHIFVYIMLAFNLSVIHSSRGVLSSPNDDMIFYYSTIYKSSFFDQLNVWKASPVEPLIFLFISFLRVITVNLSPAGLMFIFTFTTSLMLLYGVIKLSKNVLNNKIEPIVVSATLLSFGYFYSTQLVRQQFSMVFALAALVLVKNGSKKGILLWLTSLSFHLGSLLYLFIVTLSERITKLKIYIAVLFGFFSLLIFLFLAILNSELYSHLEKIPLLLYKFKFYHDKYQLSNLMELKLSIISQHDTMFLTSYLFLILFSVLLNFNKLNNFEFRLFIGVFILYVLFLPFTLFGFRLSLFVTSVLFGFYKVWTFQKISILLRVYVLFKILTLCYFLNYSYKKLGKDGMEIFNQFPPYSGEFLYYLKSFII